jgi:hypothetical protein
MEDGFHWKHFSGNDAVIAAVKKWVALARAGFYDPACRRFLFIAGENA